MGLSSSMYTGLSGMNVNQSRIDTIGNNIANVNTTAFKGSRTLFQTQFYETMNQGTAPRDVTGGVNPMQVGHGAVVGTTQQSFATGSIQTTGIVSDMAIEGGGFFVVRTDQNTQAFTRDGAFDLDSNNQLVTTDGHYLQGYGVDDNFTIDPTALQDLTVPLGMETIGDATTTVQLDGDLSSDGAVADTSSISAAQALVDGSGANADENTLLTDLEDPASAGVKLFADGDAITVAGVTKGDRELPTQTFTVGVDGTTYGDYAGWLEETLGIQNVAGVPGNPGVTIDGGALTVRSNAGVQNEIVMQSNDVTTTSANAPLPFQFSQQAAAAGASVFTGFTVYDSLGTPVQVQVTFALEEKAALGPVWRFYAESANNSGQPRALGTGTVAFDNNGNLREVTGNQISIDRSAAGAASPLTFSLDFQEIYGLSTQTSAVLMSDQDGYPPGKLTGWSVAKDGVITGTFSNGQTQTLGQVALATFANPEGLVAESDNLYVPGPNSGATVLTTPGEFGAGWVRSGALELSNVDLGSEFIGLVNASTGFQASSRVITVSSDLLNQLLLIVR